MPIRQTRVRALAALIAAMFSPVLLAQELAVPAAASAATRAAAAAEGEKRLDNVVVIGSRRTDQTVLNSATPVEVVTGKQLAASGAKNLASALTQLVPSINYDAFNNSNNSGARPIQFRSLGPDQVLILVNGKRRHASALIHGKASYARGSQFVDLANIPVSAIARVEVLRDGASAQYGSDAIAGVINVVLAEKDNGGEADVRVGEYNTDDRGGIEKTYSGWKGFRLGEDGFLTVAAEYKDQKRARNPYTDSRQQYFAGDARESTINRHQGSGGTADIDSKALTVNAELPVGADVQLYGFATYAYRFTQAPGVWRRPQEDTNVRVLFPDGYAPELGTTSEDAAGALGLRFGNVDGGGAYDISLNYGRNNLYQTVTKSVNASYGAASPTEFYLGRLANEQTNLNLDYTRNIASSLSSKPWTLGAGATARSEDYAIDRGDFAGYAHGGAAILDGPNRGKAAAPGVQGFTAYQPQDEGNIKREVYGAYASLEGQLSEQAQIGLAARTEHYSDFGWTKNGKLTARYDFTPAFAVRGTVSNGFRAPSVGQIGFSNTTVTWVGGTQFDTRIFPVAHPAARTLGASDLRPEKSRNYTIGTVLRPAPRTSLAVDLFQIDIRDRITLTDNLTGTFVTGVLTRAGYSTVRGVSFLFNGLDTQTRGVDVTAKQQFDAAGGKLDLSVAANLSRTNVEDVKANPAILQNTGVTLIGRQTVGLTEKSVPKTKLVLGSRYDAGRWSVNATVTRFGKFEVIDTAVANDDRFAAQWVTDASAAFKATSRLTLALGANNLFNTHPTYSLKQLAASGGLSGPYLRTGPAGALGRFIYASAGYAF